jgi:predicted transposase YdaD
MIEASAKKRLPSIGIYEVETKRSRIFEYIIPVSPPRPPPLRVHLSAPSLPLNFIHAVPKKTFFTQNPSASKRREGALNVMKAVKKTDSKSRLGRRHNRKYKDGLFRAIFKNRERFLELYGTVKGKTYDENTVMRETTLTNTIYHNVKNDVSFEIDGKIVVFMEHQSTINPNIAMRMLIYASETYKPMIDSNKIYGPQKVFFPRPEFYVFYNGKPQIPERQTIRLSEFFEPCENKNPPTLDLAVDIININIGNNPDLLSKCETLSHYEIFIEQVREYKETHDHAAAIELAIKKCMGDGILTEYLKKYGKEVLSMLCVELDEAVQRELWTEYGREQGVEQGVKQGVEQGMKQGVRDVLALLEKGVPVEEIRKILCTEMM